MKKSEDSVAFYKLLFNEELYNLPADNIYSATQVSPPPAMVSEAGHPYNSPPCPFEGITSKTLIMFNHPENELMPPHEKALLEQILKAVGISFDSVSRLNTSLLQDNIAWEHIAPQSAADYVIAFGVDKKYLPAGIDEGQIYNMDNKRTLCSATLNELLVNNNRKKLLWQGLKEIYGI